MTEAEKAKKVAEYLEANRADFVNDPRDDSFWVHRRIIESIQKSFQRRGKKCRDPFGRLKDEFMFPVIMLQPGGQQEIFMKNLPGIERILFIKGNDLCICGLQEVFAWE